MLTGFITPLCVISPNLKFPLGVNDIGVLNQSPPFNAHENEDVDI